MTTAIERQLRCTSCNRRLADYENAVTAGGVTVEIKCPKCGEINRLNLISR